jgi:cytochrome c-type biogenesis protein CcmH/NrfF
LAKHKSTSSKVSVAEAPAPVAAPISLAVKSVAAPVQSVAQQSAESKASQEKVKEMASKLGVPFTADLMALGSNSAISDALIEKAVAAGKSETEINSAMASL